MEAELDSRLRGNDGRKKQGRPLDKTTEVVRAYFSQAGRSSRAACSGATGIERRRVETAIETLIRGKRLRRISRGAFEWIPEKRPVRSAPIEERIWHAMRINPTWCAADIAQQAGTIVSYVYKRLRVYRAAGFIARAGIHVGHNGTIKLWRLNAKGQAHIELPRVEEYSPDELVVAVVKLNRLVCTGLVRFVDERAQAVKLCGEILEHLTTKSTEDTERGESGKEN
jgi:hypothetical protein